MNEPAKLEPCPLCGKQLTVYGPEDWKPTFYDPDSGGDPYNAVCDCGFSFCNESYDYGKFVAGLNRRSERTGRWIEQHDYPGTYSRCSACDQLARGYAPSMKFCPNCGAHMIGG